jgi:hypothetical protein
MESRLSSVSQPQGPSQPSQGPSQVSSNMSSAMNEKGKFSLPIDVATIIFIVGFLIISSIELYLGSPNGFSPIKIIMGLFFVALMQYIIKSSGQAWLAWTLLIVFFMTYFIITIVATSCAQYNMKQLKLLRDVGLISPFVLSKKKLETLRKSKGKDDDDSDDDDDEDDEDDDGYNWDF